MISLAQFNEDGHVVNIGDYNMTEQIEITEEFFREADPRYVQIYGDNLVVFDFMTDLLVYKITSFDSHLRIFGAQLQRNDSKLAQ